MPTTLDILLSLLLEGLRGRKVDAEMPVVKSGWWRNLRPRFCGDFGLG
jgi:hypothetical protein